MRPLLDQVIGQATGAKQETDTDKNLLIAVLANRFRVVCRSCSVHGFSVGAGTGQREDDTHTGEVYARFWMAVGAPLGSVTPNTFAS